MDGFTRPIERLCIRMLTPSISGHGVAHINETGGTAERRKGHCAHLRKRRTGLLSPWTHWAVGLAVASMQVGDMAQVLNSSADTASQATALMLQQQERLLARPYQWSGRRLRRSPELWAGLAPCCREAWRESFGGNCGNDSRRLTALRRPSLVRVRGFRCR